MEQYYYGVGRVRALEARLVTTPQLERMAAAPDFQTAFNVLNETPYAENLPHLKSPFDYEELFDLERRALRKLLEKLAPRDEIIQAALKGDFPFLKQASSLLLRELAHHQLDLLNLKILLRCQAAGRDKPFFESKLVDTGFIKKDILLSLYDKSSQEIASRLYFTTYFPEIASGLEYFEKNRSFHLLEKQMDDFIIEKFRKAKYVNSGAEPLIGFYLAKEAEIKTLRFILICKQNHVESEQIKGRLRVSY